MRALIVGIDGTIGALLAQRLAGKGWSVAGTSRRAGSRAIALDLAADDAAVMDLPAVDVAFFCAAMARFADCRERPELTHRVNVSTPVALATRLAAAGTRVVLLSTSAVFDGSRPFSPADRPVCPASAYGAQKAEAEAGFLALGARAAVLRLTKVIHPGFSLFAGWLDRLRRGEAIRAFTDLTVAPLLPEHVTDALEAVALDAGGGIYQVSGARDIPYFEAAAWLARHVGANATLVEAGTTAEAGLPAGEVLAFTSLDCARLTALSGFVPPEPEAVLAWPVQHE
ncbi:MAG: sugar nucleotide-binding protein [Rhodospirillaceae bacterium]